ncbi:unnamed protein product [Sphagnum balticum]
MDMSKEVIMSLIRGRGMYERLFSESVSNEARPNSTQADVDINSWDKTELNPKNRIDSLRPIQNPTWEICGTSDFGTRFQARPMLPDLSPSGIDVYIPDHDMYPPELRSLLELNASTYIMDASVQDLAISQLILRGLEHWSAYHPNFEADYRGMPFGSRIVFNNISSKVSEMKISLIPAHEFTNKLLTAEALRSMWAMSEESWVPTLDLAHVNFSYQLHDTVSLVHIPLVSDDAFIFKYATSEAGYLYHELRNLLQIPPHPYVASRPLFIITDEKCDGGNGPRVCGFLLTYYQSGTLQQAIEFNSHHGQSSLKDQLNWAMQTVEAISHVRIAARMFYSDLKLDNLLLSDDGGGEHVVLIDFEQAHNWIMYSAPEIFYVDLLRILCRAMPDNDKRREYKEWLQFLVKPEKDLGKGPELYENPEHGYYNTWIALSSSEQEAAEVFMVGKVLWCIFEGLGCPQVNPGKRYLFEPEYEFPEFRHTPKALQDLVQSCTAGDPEWVGQRQSAVIRVGDKLYPKGRSGVRGEPVGTPEETLAAAKSLWSLRMQNMQSFVAAQVRLKKGQAREDDFVHLSYLKRPRLEEVWNCLSKFRKEIGN